MSNFVPVSCLWNGKARDLKVLVPWRPDDYGLPARAADFFGFDGLFALALTGRDQGFRDLVVAQWNSCEEDHECSIVVRNLQIKSRSELRFEVASFMDAAYAEQQ